MSRSPGSLKKESERKILDFINRQDRRQARSKEIETGTGLGSTCYPHLRRFEKEGVLEVERGRGLTIYKWTRNAENMLSGLTPPELRGPRQFYEKLTQLVEMKVSSRDFIEKLVPAIGVTMVPVLLESIEKRQGILLEPVINDFKSFIKKYLEYKRYPILYANEIKDVKEELKRLNELRSQIDEQPDLFRKQLAELQEETNAFRKKLLVGGRIR